jgi:hypothetical protein
MHDAADEAEPLGDVAAIAPDILFRYAAILSDPLVEIDGT